MCLCSFFLQNTTGYSSDNDYVGIGPKDTYNVIFNNTGGAVCIAWGFYIFDAKYKIINYVAHIPQTACLTPPSGQGNHCSVM